MRAYQILYNRFAEQNRGPAVDFLYGDEPKAALKEFYHYVFRRVVGEEGLSPDIVLCSVRLDSTGKVVDRFYTYKFIAVRKVGNNENRPKSEQAKDPETHRYIKRKN